MTLYLREGGYYLRADGDVVGPCVAGPNCNYPWRIGCVYYQDDGTNDLGKPARLLEEVDKSNPEASIIYVRWGSYCMGFRCGNIETAVKRFAARVPLHENSVVSVNYGFNTERIWHVEVGVQTVYHVGEMKLVE